MSNTDPLPQISDTANTHVVFVENAPKYQGPTVFFKTDLKQSTDAGDVIITDNPGACCYVFQLRTILQSKVEIERKDFNTK